MKATELRIGNFVNVNGWFAEIAAIGYNYVDISNGIEEHFIKELEPIPLTEEWLERFGFDRADKFKDYEYIDGMCEFVLLRFGSTTFEIRSFDESTGESWYLLRLKYVHQLQNLYFAIIGEELTIKE